MTMLKRFGRKVAPAAWILFARSAAAAIESPCDRFGRDERRWNSAAAVAMSVRSSVVTWTSSVLMFCAGCWFDGWQRREQSVQRTSRHGGHG